MSDDQKTAQEKALEEKATEVKATNEKRLVAGKDKEGNDIKVFPKGTLLKMGQTRGRNPQIVSWEAFDLERPETLPTSLDEFLKLTNLESDAKAEEKVLSYVIDGFNDAQYTEASDPIAEFVETSWPPEIQKSFRLAVRNYSNMLGISIEESGNALKPAVMKAQEKKG